MSGIYHIDPFSACIRTNVGPRRFCEMFMKRVICSFFPYTSFLHRTEKIELLIPNLVLNIAFVSWPGHSVILHSANPMKMPSTNSILCSNPVVLTFFLNFVRLLYSHSDLAHPFNHHLFLCYLQSSFWPSMHLNPRLQVMFLQTRTLVILLINKWNLYE